MEFLDGYPDDVLAISAKGHVTADDYRDHLIPELKARLERHPRIRVLCIFGPEYKGFSPGAAWSDLQLGMSHWSEFGRIAVVTDVEWLRNVARLFAPFYHHAIRAFSLADASAARDWILSEDKS